MKKLLLITVLFLLGMAAQAQSFYDDFENHLGWEDFWQSQNIDKVEVMPIENPLKDAVNSSDWVMELNRKVSSSDAVQRKFDATPLSMGEGATQYQYLHFKIYSPKNESIRIKLYQKNVGAEVAFKDIYWSGYPEYALNSGWADVCIWLGDAAGYDGTPLNCENITKVAIRPNSLSTNEAYITYIDDVYFSINETDKAPATGIMGITEITQKNNGVAYTLAGQRVGDSVKGIIINNGKKIIRK